MFRFRVYINIKGYPIILSWPLSRKVYLPFPDNYAAVDKQLTKPCKISIYMKGIYVYILKRVYKIVAKGEFSNKEQFLLLSQCFLKVVRCMALDSICMWERLYTHIWAVPRENQHCGLRKVSIRISLSMPRRLTLTDTFRLMWIFCFRNHYSIYLFPPETECIGLDKPAQADLVRYIRQSP